MPVELSELSGCVELGKEALALVCLRVMLPAAHVEGAHSSAAATVETRRRRLRTMRVMLCLVVLADERILISERDTALCRSGYNFMLGVCIFGKPAIPLTARRADLGLGCQHVPCMLYYEVAVNTT